MKKYLIAIAMVLTLGQNAEAVAQKHRHTPRTEQVDSSKNKKDAIEAFSDTTSAADAEDAEDDKYITYRRGTTYSTSSDVHELKEVMESVGGIFGPMLAVGIVAFVVIFFLLPLLIIVTIIYFVNKNRKERYRLAQMAIQNGQPIPDDILKNKASSELGNDYQTGVRQMFTGVGLAIFLGFIIGKVGIGIGALVFFIGLGKWFIYRQNNNTGNDDFLNHNNSNQFNNN